MNYNIGVDLGGTNIATGIVDESFNIVGRGLKKTAPPKTPEEISVLICSSIEAALDDAGLALADISRVGVGVPGIVDAVKGEVVFASNLGFRNVPLAALLGERLGKPVFLENDANAAIYGEVVNGAAKGFSDVVMLTLGTGIGGGVIINGRIYSGFNAQGAELGHVGIFYGGEKCLCGHTGCIELYCSATALIKQTRKAMQEAPDSLMWSLCADLENADGRTAFEAMRLGDRAAAAVIGQYLDYLGYTVVNYIHIFQPEVFIIGGGLAAQGQVISDALEDYAGRNALGYTKESHTLIKMAELGNDAGIIGAAYVGG